ncbi:hypothetical protein GCM10022226_18990 [Sphaerisporangium flaviroseum]|uniref:Uncharacterized protein n=1 Tax=Sphaerisporangium flaviroseum TaxID=509199 RepID=A0ABP7HMN7_9ACTN
MTEIDEDLSRRPQAWLESLAGRACLEPWAGRTRPPVPDEWRPATAPAGSSDGRTGACGMKRRCAAAGGRASVRARSDQGLATDPREEVPKR